MFSLPYSSSKTFDSSIFTIMPSSTTIPFPAGDVNNSLLEMSKPFREPFPERWAIGPRSNNTVRISGAYA